MLTLFVYLFPQIVYVKPPWSLQDVLQCLKKHWIAVFGFIVPRSMHQTVLNLIHFFNPGLCVGDLNIHITYHSDFPGFFAIIQFCYTQANIITPVFGVNLICLICAEQNLYLFFI